jgi:hypothetical protein
MSSTTLGWRAGSISAETVAFAATRLIMILLSFLLLVVFLALWLYSLQVRFRLLGTAVPNSDSVTVSCIFGPHPRNTVLFCWVSVARILIEPKVPTLGDSHASRVFFSREQHTNV